MTTLEILDKFIAMQDRSWWPRLDTNPDEGALLLTAAVNLSGFDCDEFCLLNFVDHWV